MENLRSQFILEEYCLQALDAVGGDKGLLPLSVYSSAAQCSLARNRILIKGHEHDEITY